jgi:hypothetical protein
MESDEIPIPFWIERGQETTPFLSFFNSSTFTSVTLQLVARKLLHGAILTRVVPFWRNCTKQIETKSLPQLDGVPFNGCRNQRKD